MKKNNLFSIYSLAIVALFIAGCEKKIEIPQTNNAVVTFIDGGTNFVTADKTVNPKDSILFSYTVTSTADIKYVGIQKNGTDAKTFFLVDTLSSASKNSYSAVKRLAADSAAGVYKYRIVALNAQGIYVGSNEIVITVSADFIYYSLRVLQVPDSVAKTNKSYFATSNGNTYSYADGAANSALIDFAYYYDTTQVLAGSPAVLTPKGHTIYALNTPVNPFAPYDLSSFTKNATLLKLTTTVTFTSLTSGGALRTAGIAALTSGAVTRVSTTDRAAASQSSHLTGAVILFKTVAGKYGALTINFTNHNGPAHDSFVNIDVKVQK